MGRRKYIAETDPPYEAADTTLTARQILGFLRRKYDGHDGQDWIYVEELTTSTGTADATRIDAFVMHTLPSLKLQRHAFEVKISRADFLRELKTPAKRRYGMMFSNYFHFVTPRGLVSPEEIPAGCGLWEYNRKGSLHAKLHAPYRDSTAPTWAFMAALSRRIRKEADKRVLAEFGYEQEQLTARQALFAAERQAQQERADLITRKATALADIVYEGRRQLDQYRDDMGLDRTDWLAMMPEELKEDTGGWRSNRLY